MFSMIKDFLKLETASGIILVIAAVLAVIMANTPLAGAYNSFINLPVEIRLGALHLDKPLLLWINDGLMAVFFFLVGLELKREILIGELSDVRKIALPAIGAVGGMLVPAIIYVIFNWGDSITLRGWAIPSATDIAFALGVILLLGDRVPTGLKVFLVSLAIFDDVGAIIIIALFYTSELSLIALGLAAACLVLLAVLNNRRIMKITPYIIVGAFLWLAVLKSGVHATVAGVALAMFIPLRDPRDADNSPLLTLERNLHGIVAFGILPLFAFANSGMSLVGIDTDQYTHPVTLGVALGLFLGKQIGVFSFCWVAARFNLAALPERTTWSGLYGAAILCGIGFTMSLFIGNLAFMDIDKSALFDERLGIITGSLLSAIAGYFYLRFTLKPRH